MIDRYVSPEELKRLVSLLLVVILGICIFALFAFLVVPSMRNANKPAGGPTINAPQGESGWLDETEYPPSKGYTLEPLDPKEVMTPTPELLARGKTLFADNCAACHGEAGRGDGPAAKGLNPPPRNLTQGQGWTNGPQIEGIWKTLQEGVKGTAMASYTVLPSKDRMALIHYVRSLGNFTRPPEDPTKLEALGQSFASKGEVVPPKIPVSEAMRKLERESSPPAPLALGGPGDARGIARRAVTDPQRAAITLAAIPLWRTDENALAVGVTRGLPANGFSPAVATFSAEEWRELQRELAGMNAPAKALSK